MSLLNLLLFFTFLIIVVTVWWYWTIPKNLPPGPKGLPFLGSSLEVWKASTLVETLMKWKEDYGSVYKLYVGEVLVVVLADWNMINEALVKQGDAYIGRPSFGLTLGKAMDRLGLSLSEGKLWKTQRRFALSTLRDFGIGRPLLEPRILDEVEYLLAIIKKQNKNPFDPTMLLYNAVSNVICALVFGRRFLYDDETFHSVINVMTTRFNKTDVSIIAPTMLSPFLGEILKFSGQVKSSLGRNQKLVEFYKEQIAQTLKGVDLDKIDEPTNYIQAFYKVQHEEGHWTFTDEQLIASVGNLFVAGTETTATTIRWAILFMAHYPEIQEKIYREIKNASPGQSLLNYADRGKLPFTEATIMEVQRLGNLLPIGVLRRSVAPSKLNGYDIPVGTVIVPFLTASLCDPDVYSDPHVFNPSRFLHSESNSEEQRRKSSGSKSVQYTHFIPFQAGKRICLGESLARMELFLFFTALISRYRFYFPPDEAKPPLETPALLVHAPPTFNICAEPRSD